MPFNTFVVGAAILAKAGSQDQMWTAQRLRSLAAEPEVGSLIPPLGLLDRAWTLMVWSRGFPTLTHPNVLGLQAPEFLASTARSEGSWEFQSKNIWGPKVGNY